MKVRFLGLGGHGVRKGPCLCFHVFNFSSFFILPFCVFSWKMFLVFSFFLYFFRICSISGFSIIGVSSVVGAPWRCGVLTKLGGISWDWVGPPTWERACIKSPEWSGGSSPVKTEPPPRLDYCCCCWRGAVVLWCCVAVVVVVTKRC